MGAWEADLGSRSAYGSREETFLGKCGLLCPGPQAPHRPTIRR